MPVFTIMAEGTEHDQTKLHTVASSSATLALERVDEYRRDGLRNIKIYRETQQIEENELKAMAAREKR